jgi:hypothetical protein
MGAWEDMLKTVGDGIKPLFVEFVNSLSEDLATEVPEYAEEVAVFLAEWLQSNVEVDDATLKRNLAHCRLQLQNLAVKHAIKVHRKTMQLIEKATEILMQALVVALKVTMA